MADRGIVTVFRTHKGMVDRLGDTWWIAQGDGWGDIQVEAETAGVLGVHRLDESVRFIMAVGDTDGMTSECRQVTPEEGYQAMNLMHAGLWT